MRRTFVAVLAVGLSACGPAVFSMTSVREQDRLPEASPVAKTKADVLARMGPPDSLIGQDRGDIFVYRRLARDTRTITLNPGYVIPSSPSVPIWIDSDVSGRDDVLMVFFDENGKVQAMSLRTGISEADELYEASWYERMKSFFR